MKFLPGRAKWGTLRLLKHFGEFDAAFRSAEEGKGRPASASVLSENLWHAERFGATLRRRSSWVLEAVVVARPPAGTFEKADQRIKN